MRYLSLIIFIFCLLSCDDPLPMTPDETEVSCSDGIQNGDETDVDCGGSCPACISCDDGIQNGDETGIDCGGICPPCITCDDGIQNGDETGIDCGGSCPNDCPSCDDGIQNGDETGIDCGGTCVSCTLGSYLGNLACPGVLALISDDEFAFTIYEGVSGDTNEVIVFLEELNIPIEGTVNGFVVSLNSTAQNYPFDATGDGMPDLSVDFEFRGILELNADGNNMIGIIDIVLRSTDVGALLGEDSCSVDAVKQ